MLPPMRLMWRLCSAINRGCWNISLLLVGSSSLSKTFSNCEILSCQFQGNSFNERENSDEETLKKRISYISIWHSEKVSHVCSSNRELAER